MPLKYLYLIENKCKMVYNIKKVLEKVYEV